MIPVKQDDSSGGGVEFDYSDIMGYATIRGSEARITRELLACPERKRLTYTAFLVLTALMTYASPTGDRNVAWASVRQLIDITGMSDRSVRYATRDLETFGFAEKVPSADNPQRIFYRLTLPPSVRAMYIERMRANVAAADRVPVRAK